MKINNNKMNKQAINIALATLIIGSATSQMAFA